MRTLASLLALGLTLGCSDNETTGHADNCASPEVNCSPNATCTSSGRSFRCTCNAGFVGDGVTCDPDQCADGLDDCSADADCTDTASGWSCDCHDGYDGDGVTCSEIDECADGLDDCSADADCANTPGAWLCTCHDGFEGDGVICTDVDECTRGTDTCHADAACTNTPGSYECACNAGWEGDGYECTFTCPQPAPTGDLPLVHSIPVRCSVDGIYSTYVTGDVAIAEDVLAVGMPSWLGDPSTQRATALLFRFDGSQWLFAQELVPAEASSDAAKYGNQVEMSATGDTIVVGTQRDAFLFRRNGSTWEGGQRLFPAFDTDAGTLLATVATTDERTALAYYRNSATDAGGGVYVFAADTRAEVQRLMDPRFSASSSGNSVALGGDLLVVANRVTGGAAMVAVIYRWGGTSYAEEQAIAGHEASTDGERVAVSDYATRTVRLYEHGANWTEAASVGCGYDCDLSLLGDRFVTGGDPYHGGDFRGSVHERDGSTWPTAYTPAYEAYSVDLSSSFAVMVQGAFAADAVQVIQLAPYP
jgi:hypothetical protein